MAQAKDLEHVARHLAQTKVVLPTFSELAEPHRIDASVTAELNGVDKNAADARNLFRVHWYNQSNGPGRVDVPEHVVLPPEVTGVESPIIVVFGDSFPMITAHKVLAAYACLAPRLVEGSFDPTRDRAVWPSTGNYCRGGIAISRIMGCHGVAVLPEGMSQERFDWLAKWVASPDDIIRTPGTESNVKEIYDECHRLAQRDDHVILNQFSEYPNHLGHYSVTGKALAHVVREVMKSQPGLQLAGFTSATGSAGTIAAGDFLKEEFGSRVVAVEATECPTMLENGFGEHNIQGIGDKHVPLIHNVMNTDVVVGVSDASTNALGVLFNSDAGQEFLRERKGWSPEIVKTMSRFGFSALANTLAAIKTARRLRLSAGEAMVTVATDGWPMYASEAPAIIDDLGGRFDALQAAEVFGQHWAGVNEAQVEELTHEGRRRVFNLGYYTWVEQQGISVEDFEARRHQSFWRSMRPKLSQWDEQITEINKRAKSLA